MTNDGRTTPRDGVIDMQLDGKVGIVYGATGSMGSAVARAFAAAGAQVFLAGRTGSKVARGVHGADHAVQSPTLHHCDRCGASDGAQRQRGIVMLTSSAAKEWRHQMGGFSVGCAAIEVLTRTLAGELKGTGVRVACIRANFTPETVPDLPDGALGPLLVDTLVPRLPRLDEIAAAATFLASDEAGATTGTVLDLTCGAIVN